jgi:hypothetical protein
VGRPVAEEAGEGALPDAGDEGAEGVGEDDDPPGVVDAGDRLVERPEAGEGGGGEGLGEEEGQHVAPPGGADLGPHRGLQAPPGAPGAPLHRLEGPPDLVVVGDGDDVEVGVGLGVGQDSRDGGQAVAAGAVDVEVGGAEGIRR